MNPPLLAVQPWEWEVDPEGVGTTYRIVEKMGPVPIETTSRYTEFVRNERIVETISGHLSGKFVHTFEPEGSGMQFTLEHIPTRARPVPSPGAGAGTQPFGPPREEASGRLWCMRVA